jgi:hypothetical protein
MEFSHIQPWQAGVTLSDHVAQEQLCSFDAGTTSKLSTANFSSPVSMSLHEVWQAAASSPFEPSVGEDSQLYVGFILLLIGLVFTGLFGLSMLC